LTFYAFFLLLSADRKKIVRTVALRPSAAATRGLFSDSESDVEAIFRPEEPLGPSGMQQRPAGKLSRRELALLRPLIAAGPCAGGRWWASTSADGLTSAVCRDEQSRAFVALIGGGGGGGHVAAGALQRVTECADRIAERLGMIEACLLCLKANNIAVVP
jgi:hypothetical protein